jgi:hypothetical protein
VEGWNLSHVDYTGKVKDNVSKRKKQIGDSFLKKGPEKVRKLVEEQEIS